MCFLLRAIVTLSSKIEKSISSFDIKSFAFLSSFGSFVHSLNAFCALMRTTSTGLEVSKRGTIVVNDKMQSSIPTLFAGGDIVRGGATVILAMADGRKAAEEMHEYLKR